jgi:hypothetical protein
MDTKQCPRCGITCDKYDAEAIDEIFGFRMYKNAEYQQSQCKKCRSKKPIGSHPLDAYLEVRPIKQPIEVVITEAEWRPKPKLGVRDEHGNIKPARISIVELKPCQQDNQPLVKFPIASEPTELERDLLKSIYIKHYPRDKEGPKRSYKFMWDKLHKRGLV